MKNIKHAWTNLEEDKKRIAGTTLLELFDKNPNRFNEYSFRIGELLIDLSKNLIDESVLQNLQELARLCKLHERRDKLFSGEIANFSENRPALHTALRAPSDEIINVKGKNIGPEVQSSFGKVNSFASSIRDGTHMGSTGKAFTDVLHIGTGGSIIGPQMVVEALSSYLHETIKTHFVSNANSADLKASLQNLNPETTLIIVASKTFTTQETILNAKSAKDWIIKKLGTTAVADHFVAISNNIKSAKSFGIMEKNIFEIWDWVGGRFSLWSAIGLPIAIAVGSDNFKLLLSGGQMLDNHFRTAIPEKNLPILMGLIEVWYRSVMQFGSRAIIPYDSRLDGFISHIQQLEMESNGKSIDKEGVKVTQQTAGIVWGAAGTNAQHSFFQLLHQGVDIIPCDFLATVNSDAELPGHQDTLLANFLAQTKALMTGRSLTETIKHLKSKGLSEAEVQKRGPHSTFPGNRPSTTILCRHLNPHTLGMLIALYEHKIFVQGVIWNINSFDQWGVELGKEIAQELLPQLEKGIENPGLDSSTSGLLNEIRKHRKEKKTK